MVVTNIIRFLISFLPEEASMDAARYRLTTQFTYYKVGNISRIGRIDKLPEVAVLSTEVGGFWRFFRLTDG